METIYWGCLIGGAIFAIVSLVLGDLIDGLLDGAFELPGIDFLKPVVLAGSITAFGGAGIMLTRYSSVSAMCGTYFIPACRYCCCHAGILCIYQTDAQQ